MELFKRGPATRSRLIALGVLAVVLMIVDSHEEHTKLVHQALGVVATPLQYAVDAPFMWFQQGKQYLTTQQTLLTEKKQLEQEVLQLRFQNLRLTALDKENEQLRGLLKSAGKMADRVVVARLLDVATTPYVQQFTLANGEAEGVHVGQAVLDAYGVLGQVIRVDAHTSQVLLATDSRSAIPVESARNGIRGIIVGQGDTASLRLLYVPKTAHVVVGDEFITSGLGRRFPQGYPVGVVSSVIHTPGEHFKTVLISPRAHFLSNNVVLLVAPQTMVKAADDAAT